MAESYWPASLSNSIKFICFIIVENLDFTAEIFQIDPKGEVLPMPHDIDLRDTDSETNWKGKKPSSAYWNKNEMKKMKKKKGKEERKVRKKAMAVMCFYDWLKLSSPIVQNVIHVKSIKANLYNRINWS